MVTNITSLTGNGLKDWLIQRVSALYLTAYFIYMCVFFWVHPHFDYAQWDQLFRGTCFQITTEVALFAFIFHSWIGIWTVIGDYIKRAFLRLSVQMSVTIWLFALLTWGSIIIWR
jgi:succinate dehydrogenase / fumarate reductase membrane anchor subunit